MSQFTCDNIIMKTLEYKNIKLFLYITSRKRVFSSLGKNLLRYNQIIIRATADDFRIQFNNYYNISLKTQKKETHIEMLK